MAGLIQTIPPTAEPVTLAEARTWVRIDADDTTQDGPLTGLITAARQKVEIDLNQQLVSATWLYMLDRFPYLVPGRTWQWPGDVWDRQNASWLEGLTVRMPRPPLQQVTQIQYLDTSGTLQTLASTAYLVDTVTRPGRVMPPFGQIWPVTQVTQNGAQFTYQAGYGPVTTVAASISSGQQTITPANMTGIFLNTTLLVEPGANQEIVGVTAVTATTFTATFAKAHGAGVTLNGVPDGLRTAILLLVAHWWMNREAAGTFNYSTVPLGYQSLIDAAWHGEYPSG